MKTLAILQLQRAWRALRRVGLCCLSAALPALYALPADAYVIWDVSLDKSPCQQKVQDGTIDFPCQEIGIGFDVGAQDKAVTGVRFKFGLDIKPFPQGQAQGQLLVQEKDPAGWDMQIVDASDTVRFVPADGNTGVAPGTTNNVFAAFLVTGADPSGPSGFTAPPFPYSFDVWLLNGDEVIAGTHKTVRVSGLGDSTFVPEPAVASLLCIGLVLLGIATWRTRRDPHLPG